MEKLEHKRKLKKFDAEIWRRLPQDTNPLYMIREKGCDNTYFTLSEDAKETICKYNYCGMFGMCRGGS